jgi:hypothetical protein
MRLASGVPGEALLFAASASFYFAFHTVQCIQSLQWLSRVQQLKEFALGVCFQERWDSTILHAMDAEMTVSSKRIVCMGV